jgi:hypothetical protein
MHKEELLAKLKDNLLEVTFTKVNGDQRVMTCTLKTDIVPQPTGSVNQKRKTNTDVISVWDTNAAGWRSFRYDNIVSIREI